MKESERRTVTVVVARVVRGCSGPKDDDSTASENFGGHLVHVALPFEWLLSTTKGTTPGQHVDHVRVS